METLDGIVWGIPLLLLLLGTGAFLMIRMRFLPVRRLGYALGCAVGRIPEKDTVYHERRGAEKGMTHSERRGAEKGMTHSERRGAEKGISPRSSLMTELAATIGIGNIVGVATAMVLGGPGALFWMMAAAFLGLPLKFAESELSVKYRVRTREGRPVGGPMYTLERAFPNRAAGRFLAKLYAVFAVFASFGMGNMTQANAIAKSVRKSFGVTEAETGLVLTIVVIIVVLGGIGMISGLASYLVPGMALFYLIGILTVILTHASHIPDGIADILTQAFSARSAAGGIGGMMTAMRYGVSRGVFSNEAGLGAGGITAAAARTNDPVRQGYISMTGVFFDTMVLCLLTGMALAVSGVLGIRNDCGQPLTGVELMIAVFGSTFGEAGAFIVSIGMTLFAFATIIAWEYQGECAFAFLAGKWNRRMIYRMAYGLVTFVGAVCSLELVWDFSDIMNGLMAVPNLICVLVLSGTVCRDMREY